MLIDFPYLAFPNNLGHWAQTLVPLFCTLASEGWKEATNGVPVSSIIFVNLKRKSFEVTPTPPPQLPTPPSPLNFPVPSMSADICNQLSSRRALFPVPGRQCSPPPTNGGSEHTLNRCQVTNRRGGNSAKATTSCWNEAAKVTFYLARELPSRELLGEGSTLSFTCQNFRRNRQCQGGCRAHSSGEDK